MAFKNKVAIVTGGGQGIGNAYVSALLKAGVKVCICDINENLAKEYIEKLPHDQKDCVIFQKCDVTSFSDFKDAFERVVAHFGRIDVVVNNAGIFNEHDWKKMIEINFIGVVHGIKLAFEYMSVSKGGHGGIVVNTASNAAFERFAVGPVYSACKNAVVGLTRSYGTDYHFEKTGVKVTAVCPIAVETTFLETLPGLSVDEKMSKEFLKDKTPLKPDTVAQALIEILHKGENGSLMKVDNQGMTFL